MSFKIFRYDIWSIKKWSYFKSIKNIKSALNAVISRGSISGSRGSRKRKLTH